MARSGRFVQQHRRLSLEVKAQLTTLDAQRDRATGDRYFRLSEETCANLSRGGAFVATEQPVRRGTRLMLELELPNGQSIETIGRVVWVRSEMSRPGVDRPASRTRQPAGVGIEFTSAATDQAELLARYLDKSLARKRGAGRKSAVRHTGTPA